MFVSAAAGSVVGHPDYVDASALLLVLLRGIGMPVRRRIWDVLCRAEALFLQGC
jgi:hypothetical protein